MSGPRGTVELFATHGAFGRFAFGPEPGRKPVERAKPRTQ
ncbi:hypothetical protein M5D96_003078, partial [Drosophila gunungcola]